MFYQNAESWRASSSKKIMIFGMSGLGKSHISSMLRREGAWYHYSVDYRIGTHYLGQDIVDLCKLEAMKNAFLSKLLRSDSIYIASNLTFENLEPLSQFLGKPGDPKLGGIEFAEYQRRQALHAKAERGAMKDTISFLERSHKIYSYQNFICDTSGSLVEIVDPDDPKDPIMSLLSGAMLPVWVAGSDEETDALVARFNKAPKPMYYAPEFLSTLWAEFTQNEDQIDPDSFVRWGFQRLIEHRLPRYEKLAQNWGVRVASADLAACRTPEAFEALIAAALEKKNAH